MQLAAYVYDSFNNNNNVAAIAHYYMRTRAENMYFLIRVCIATGLKMEKNEIFTFSD